MVLKTFAQFDGLYKNVKNKPHLIKVNPWNMQEVIMLFKTTLDF
jgi:hypothetical protein